MRSRVDTSERIEARKVAFRWAAVLIGVVIIVNINEVEIFPKFLAEGMSVPQQGHSELVLT